VEIRREEIAGLPPPEWDEVIVATGPLTSPSLAEAPEMYETFKNKRDDCLKVVLTP